MENTYGIGVANRYELFLDDESDPLETLSLKEQEKELKKKTKVAEKENNKVKPEPPKGKVVNVQKKVNKENTINKVQENKRDDVAKPNQQRNVEGKPERTYTKFNNENREERNNRRNREDRDRTHNGPTENREREERPPRREHIGENFDNRNRERGSRGPLGAKPTGPRGPRRPFVEGERPRKREFDRQSGSDKTGVKPIDKRDGGGAHNWGSHKDVIEEADKPNTDANESWAESGDKPETTAPTTTETKEEGEVEGGAPVEEEPKELTLDEWKAQRAGRAKPTYNIRKAGEGEDPSQWKKMYELRKKENESLESDDEEYDAAEYPQRVGRQKHVLDIDIQFNDTRRGGGGGVGRGGRGQRAGPRGNRPNTRGGLGGPGAESGGRPERPGAAENSGGERRERPERRFREENVKVVEERVEGRRAPKVDDERDFPSLG